MNKDPDDNIPESVQLLGLKITIVSLQGPLLLTQLTLERISNRIPSKVSDKITYSFLKCKGCTVEVWEWINNFIPHFMMGLKLNHVS